jgi:hypothetical protein
MKAATELWQDVTNFREVTLVVLAEHSISRNWKYNVPLTVTKWMSEFGGKRNSLLCLTVFIQSSELSYKRPAGIQFNFLYPKITCQLYK